jgi:hypothetical protein
MENFSPKTLKAYHAILSGVPGNISITLLMLPFLREGEIVNTEIRLDGINLPSNMLRDLADKVFAFPINPDVGYIDGSIYLEGTHHPVDVTSLRFCKSRTGYLTLILKGIYAFSDEGLGDFGDTPFTLAATVSSCAL